MPWWWWLLPESFISGEIFTNSGGTYDDGAPLLELCCRWVDDDDVDDWYSG